MNYYLNINLYIRLTSLISVFIVFSCKPNENKMDYCFPDEGIKVVVINAVLVDDITKKKTETIYYNKLGRPVIREQEERQIELNYDGINLINTTVKNFSITGEISRIDTNIVSNNDDMGRPLKIVGADGGYTEFLYQECNVEFNVIKDENGIVIQEFNSFFHKGILQSTIWKLPNDDIGQKTDYFEYVFNSKGHWIKRKYEYANGNIISEKRTIEYY